jgi:alanyl aminopeptidase
MVSEAHDARAIDLLSAAASAELAGDFAHAPAPEVLGEAMRAGLIAKGAPFANQLIKAIQVSNQETRRRQTMYAFAGIDDPGTIGVLLAYALSPRVRTGELRYLFEYMTLEPIARSALWNWYRSNYEALLARLSRDGMRSAPLILSEACDARSRDELDAFFGPKTGELTGTTRTLALAEQGISRCMAFRQMRAASIVAALHAALH